MVKRALVTGASRGIGKGIAIALAHAGYDVAIAARTVGRGDPTAEHSMSIHRVETRALPGSLEETAETIATAGREALMLRMDLTDLLSVERAIATLCERWGGVELVVNNGRHIGPGLMDTILDTPIEEYDKFVRAHGISAIRIAQLLLPHMLERGAGTFVTITSGAGYKFYPVNKPGEAGHGLGYRIGKAAGHTLVGSLLAEYGDAGIRAFNVDPGFVLTERNEVFAKEIGFDPSFAGRPDVIGAAVVWLATGSDADGLMRSEIEAQVLAAELGLSA